MEELIYYGGDVKALGGGKVGGHLIRFSTASDPDLVSDFFDAKTNIHAPDVLPVFYQHGLDRVMGKRILGEAKTGLDDVGMWVEAQLNLRDEYEKELYRLAEKGKLGWSSGALSHLVEREPVGKSWHIKSWFVGEASLTPTPAEPRNGVMPLKSLLTSEDAVHTEGGNPNVEKGEKPKRENKMDEKDIQAIADALKPTVDNAVKAAEKSVDEKIEAKAAEIAEAKVEAFKATLPEVKAGYHLEVVSDEADTAEKKNPFKSAGEFFGAVKNAYQNPWAIDKRLKARLMNEDGTKAAAGLNEAIPSQGGFLVDETVAPGLYDRMYQTGNLLSLVQRDSISGNSMVINAVDETSRATGSRKGGIQGYWIEEAGSITSSKPKFRQINLKLKKVAALAYATDEQLEDVSYMASWLQREVPDELRFLTEDAIFNGDGVGKPLGIENSPARVTVTRENASQVNYNDILNMWARRYAGYNDYVWLVNQDVMPQLDKLLLSSAVGSIPPRFVDYDAQGIMRMKGRPVIEVEYAQTLGTAGDIVLFSPSSYQLIDKASGIQSAASIHVNFTTAEQAFRFIYRVDGAPLWNSALTPFKGTNTQSPMVDLLATS